MTKKEMQELINKLSNDPIWTCYTRAALQERWNEFTQDACGIAYCDIDNMHGLNSKYGHAGVDNKIRRVISNVRNGDIVASRWLNGDELVFIIKSGDIEAFCHRVQAELQAEGISGTWAFSEWITDDPKITIDPLDWKVNQSKNKGIRGVVLS